jgi:hypothetical protein
MIPRVTVLMPVYNGEKYLEEAVESILRQTFRDFELLIVDDGSLDSTPDLLAGYEPRDPRVVIHRFAHNQGLSTTLNFGIVQARGEYIARMDADDISLPERLQEQVEFMDEHPEVGICGTGTELLSEKPRKNWQYLVSHDEIHARMLFINAIAHPTVMLRASILRKYALGYDPHVRYAQDYELWSRAITKTRFANLPKILLKYRIHTSQVGSRHYDQQLLMFDRIYRQLLEPLGLECVEGQLALHRRIALGDHVSADLFFRNTRRWLETILRANRKVRLIDPAVLENELAWRWDAACHQYAGHPIGLSVAILSTPLQFEKRAGILKLVRVLQFLIKKSR